MKTKRLSYFERVLVAAALRGSGKRLEDTEVQAEFRRLLGVGRKEGWVDPQKIIRFSS